MTDEKQFGGGALLDGESCANVCADGHRSAPNAQNFAMAGAQGPDFDVLGLANHADLRESATSSTAKCATLAAQRPKGVSFRVIGIKLDAEGWVKNVLVPALVDEFIKENGDPR